MLRKEKSEGKFGLLEIICLGFDDYKTEKKSRWHLLHLALNSLKIRGNFFEIGDTYSRTKGDTNGLWPTVKHLREAVRILREAVKFLREACTFLGLAWNIGGKGWCDTWCDHWCGHWCDYPPLQLPDNQYQVCWVSPTFAISAGACVHVREGRKISRDGGHQNGLYYTGCQPLDKLGFRQPPSGSCTVRFFAVSLHRRSALRPSTAWLSPTSISAPQSYRRKRLLFWLPKYGRPSSGCKLRVQFPGASAVNPSSMM